MADRAAIKARKRLKRERKREEIRRANSVSPYKQYARFGSVEACYLNPTWRESGMASILVVCNGPRGLALAGFVVDVWCSGLRDAWGHVGLLREDVDRMLERAREHEDTFPEQCAPEVAVGLVAGGVRFAMKNGFRLPAHYQRWVQFLGELDVKNADLSRFGKDGKLMWVGPLEKLRSLLIGCTVEEFLRRPDVLYTIGVEEDEFEEWDEDAEEEDSEWPEVVHEALDAMVELLAEQVKRWCIEQGGQPKPMLASACQLYVTGSIAAMAEADGSNVDEVMSALVQVASSMSRDQRQVMKEALHQVTEFLSSPQRRAEMRQLTDQRVASGGLRISEQLPPGVIESVMGED